MASWLDNDWLWMPKLCLRLLPAQQPETGDILDRRTQRNTFCLSCSPGSHSPVSIWSSGDQFGSTQGVHVQFGVSAHFQVSAWIGLWTGDLGLCEWVLSDCNKRS